MKKSHEFSFLLVLACLFGISLASCNLSIGLGKEVDSKEPSVTITYPPAEAAIKGSFILYGSCEDDIGLKNVTVTVKGMTVDFSKTYVAEINEKQTNWSVELNEFDAEKYSSTNGWEFPDGNYSIEVTAQDNSGKDAKSPYIRTFVIDNTAPFFVISKPGVTKDSDGNSNYGSMFTIEGTIGEAQKSVDLEVNIYDTDGNLLTYEPFVEKSVDTTGQTNVTFFQYVKNEANLTYNSIYEKASKKDADGTAYFTCTVKLTDTAKEYKNPDETNNESAGNSTTKVYLYDDVWTNLISDKVSSSAKLSVSDLNSILNGSKTEISSSWSIEAVKEKLNSCVIDSAAKDGSFEKTLAFTLNPDADPTYVFSGCSFDSENLSKNTNAAGGQTITFIASAGRDGTLVVPSSVKIWLRTIQTSEIPDIAEEIATLVENEKAGKTPDEKWINLVDKSDSKDASSTTVSIDFTLPSDIQKQEYYILAATGCDADKQYFSQNSIYGFIGNSSVQAPTVQIENPRSNAYCQAAFDISGYVSGTDVISMKGYFIDKSGNEIDVLDDSGKKITFAPVYNMEAGTFTDSVSGLQNGTYTIKYVMSDKYGQSNFAIVSFTVDSVAPDLKITSVGSDSFADGLAQSVDFYVIPSNSNTIRGSVNDEVSGLDGVYYFIDEIPSDKSTPSIKNGWKQATLTSSGWTINLDFSDLESSFNIEKKDGSQAYTLKISAVDNAGNAGEILDFVKIYPDSIEPWSTINLSEQVKDFDGKKYAKTGFTITGKITENALDSLVYSVNGGTSEKIAVGTDGSWTINFAPDKDGTYSYTFKVTDKAGNSQSYVQNITRDTVAPEIEIKSPAKGASVSSAEIKVAVTDSGSGVADDGVSYSVKKGAETVDVSAYPFKKESGLWITDSIDFTKHGEGIYTLTVDAQDRLENPSETKNITFNYDIASPKITADGITDNSAIVNAETGTFVLKGTASDSNALKSVEIREGNTILASFDENSDGWNANNFAYSYSFTNQTDGIHNYVVKATDIVRKSSEQTYVITVDTQSPEISSVSKSLNAYLDTKPQISFTATVSDEKNDEYASGLDGVYYTISETAPANPTSADLNDENTSSIWKSMTKLARENSSYRADSVDISDYADEDKTLYVYYAAIDNNGNITYSADQKTKVTVDKTAPVVKLLSYSYVGENSTEISSDTVPSAIKMPKDSAGNLKLKVQIVDTNPESLTVEVDDTKVTAEKTSEDGIYTISVDASNDDGTDSDVEIIGTDKNGRNSGKVSVKFAYDATKPVATIDTIGTDGYTKDKTLIARGTAKDNNLETVKIALYKTSDLANPVHEETALPDSSNAWTMIFDDLEDVEYQLKLTATDSYTNVTTVESNKFKVDTTLPESTLTTSDEVKDIAGKNYAKTAFSFAGKITENALDSLVYSVNGGTSEKIAVGTDGSWTIDFAPDKDGTYSYTFKVTDKAGNSNSYSKTIIRDTIAPEIEITAPLEGTSVTSSVISVSATDSGSGIADADVTYSLKKGTADVDVSAYPFKKQNGLWITDTIDFSKQGEGTYTLTINAKDKLDNDSKAKSISFYYDVSAPSITADGITDNSAIVNAETGTFVLKGTASDSNALKFVEIREGNTILASFDENSDGWNANNFAYSYSFTDQKDGIHNYTVTATDIANKPSEEVYKIYVDTQNPVISEISSDTFAYLDSTSQISFTASVTDEKNNGYASGLDGIYYTIAETAPSKPSSADLDVESTTTIWNAMNKAQKGYKADSVDFAKYTTEDKTLYVYYAAIDNNGNITYSADQKTKVTVDKSAPVIKLLSYSYVGENSSEISSDTVPNAIKLPNSSSGKMTLKVQIVDTNPESLTVKVDDNEVTAEKTSEDGVYTISVQTAKTDGTNSSITISGTDKNGRKSADDTPLKFACDASKPEATIATIGTDGFWKNTTLTVRGTALDNNLESVKIALYKTSDLKNPVKEETTETDSSNSWSVKFYELEDVEYQVILTATDTYTNQTTVESNKFKVDTLDPVTTLTLTQDSGKFLDKAFADVTGNSPFALKSGETYYSNSNFVFGGTITESNLKNVSLKVNGSAVDLTSNENKIWTYEQAKVDGTYNYVLSLEDDAGRSSEYSVTVIVDATAPLVEITSPAADVTAASLAVGGNLTENGSGVKSVTYSIVRMDGETETAVVTDAEAVVNGGKWSANSELGSTEGKFKIIAKITDNMGAENQSEAKTFWFDSANPSLELNDFASSFMKEIPEISGKASDANGIKSVEIKDNQSESKWTATVTDGKFSTKLTGITEANHTFTVTVTDNAGKPTSASKSVLYDKTAPSISDEKLTTTAAYTNGDEQWFKTINLGIKLSAEDSGAGLSTADYVVKDRDGNETSSGSLNLSDGTYSSDSVLCKSQGLNTIEITVKDKAGNPLTKKLFAYVDTEIPESLTASDAKCGDEEIENWTAETPILTNGTKDLTFTLSGKDKTEGTVANPVTDSSGLKSVALKKIGSKTFAASAVDISSGSAELTITSEQIKNGSSGDITVTLTDNAGNSADFVIASVTIDTTAPEINFSSISPVVVKTVSGATTSYLNGKISAKGSITEANSLKSAVYKVYSGDSETAVMSGNLNVTGVSNDFVLAIDTADAKITDENNIKIEITAEDEAGNISSYDSTTYNGKSYVVSQDTDRPEIKISNISAANAILSSGSVIGTISDDDGIKEFYYSENADAGEEAVWTEVDVNSSSWSLTLDGGSKNIYFKVVDSENKEFITGGDAKLNRPKLGLGNSDAEDMDSGLAFLVDLNAPEIKNLYLASSNSKDVPASDSDLWSNVSASFGKSEKYMFVKIELSEDIAMHESATDDIKITAGGTSLTLTGLTRTGTIDSLTYIAGPFNTEDDDSDSATQDLKLEGNQTLSVVATDKAGRDSSAKTMMFYVDGEAPVVSVTYPLISQEITTDIEVRGSVTDASEISVLKYMIPTAAQRASHPAKDADGWTTSATKNSFAIEYNSTSFEESSEGKLSLIWYAVQNDGTDCTYALSRCGSGTETDPYVYEKAEKSAIDGAVYIPILFYAEDSTGNGGYSESYVCVNPSKSLPTAEILAPSDNKIGTNLTLSGSASDTKEVKSVKLTNIWYTNSDDDLTDSTNSENATWTKLTGLDADGLVTIGTVDSENDTVTAEGTTSWKIRMDLSKITEEFNWIKAEIYAFDENADDAGQIARQTSAIKVVAIDKDSPSMSQNYPKLVKFDDSTSIFDENGDWTSFAVERAYEAGMYIGNNAGNISGGWYLIGEVTDDISVNGVSVTSNKGDISLAAPEDENIWQSSDKKTYRFAISVPTAKDGRIETKFALDDGQNQIPSTVVFNIDNTAPKLYITSDENPASSLEDAGTLRLKSSGLQIDADSNVVENSDGSYTFGDEVVEEGSGLAYIVYWFEKSGKVASPMFTSGMGTEIAADKTENSVYLNSENLPALYLKGVEITNGTFTVAKNDNIRAGGLVKINGTYYLISELDDTGTKVTLASSALNGTYDLEMIFAQVVNHQVTEGFDSSEATGVSNDDGDGMVEMVKQTGSSYKWSSSIYTDRISDGPATIHVTAFDEAGNSNYGYVKTSIQNNRPRLAKVYLGTDLNGNGKFDYKSGEAVVNNGTDSSTANGTEYGELSFYSALNSEGKVQGNVTLKSSGFVAKNQLMVLSEIVGGNGDLKYSYKVVDSESAATATKLADYGDSLSDFVTAADVISGDGTDDLLTSSLKLDGYNYVEGSGEYSTTRHGENSATSGSLKALVLDNEVLKTYESWKTEGETVTKTNKYIAFTFWDSTDGTTQGTDSLYALLKVPVIINVVDDVKPEAFIKPFFWNSKENGDSSFFYGDDGASYGHIDLDDGTGTSNPGVSGKIWINAKASDETLLKELYFTDPAGIKAKIADYADGKWTAVSAYTPVTENKTADDISNWGAVEFISTPEPNQSGHSVEFRIAIDMTKYGLGTNKTVDVSAVDNAAASNESAASAVQTVADAETSHYKMDFVPYIKDIYTTSIGSSSRSRLGRYPVRAGEEMTIEGMNFAKGAAYTVNFYKTASDGSCESSPVSTESVSGTITEEGKIKLAKENVPNYSRWVEVVVSDVATKNNTNQNGGYNIESGYVANDSDNGLQTANANGTNFWTDDRYISVWNTNTTFEGSINPHSGLIRKIRNVDGVNSSGKVGLKDTGSEIIPTDMTDGYLGFISSDDMRVYAYQNTTKKVAMSPTEDVSLFTSLVDAVDMVVLDGLPYYVLQTNYVGNVNANCWGPGLMLAREGFAYYKGTYESTTTLSEKTFQWIIERQGSTNSAMNRNSSDGYDSVLYQFKNPRIAGWHTDNPGDDATQYAANNSMRSQLDYIYVSYYDNYAKCLKFAAFRSGRDVDANGKISTVKAEAGSQWGGGNSDDHELVAEVRAANGNMTTGATVVAGYDTTTNNPTSFTEKAGEWSDIMVDATSGSPIPVIVYYNETNKCLEVARGNSKFPKSANYNASSVTTLSGADAWTKTTKITPDKSIDFGRYVSAAMDGAGNIHLAAQDATNAKLYYMFLTKNADGTYNVDTTKTTLIDAANGAGRWTDIELTNPAGTTPATCKPVISYINTSYLNTTNGTKVAFAESFDDNGKPEFEAMTDPAIWQAGDQRTSVLPDVKENSTDTTKAPVAVGFNSDMLALDFLRGED